MMRIKLTRNTVAGGQARLEGEEVEVSEQEARFLIAIQKAVAAPTPPKVAEPNEVIETADMPEVTEKAIRRPRRKE